MVLEEIESKYNGHIKVMWNLGLGKYIQAGGLTQSGGIVESIWREVLRKVKNDSRTLKNVLILGLGGGSAAKVVRKNWPQAKIIGVDIDEVIVNLGKKYLSLDEKVVDIRILDAMNFVSGEVKRKNQYELICIDLYNGDNFPEKFESDVFLKDVKRIMTKDGIVIFNRLYGSDHRSESMKFGRKLEKNFIDVEYVYPQANVVFFCYN